MKGIVAKSKHDPELIETHISWVILSDEFVFKIKKPIHYSFLDFSSLEKRQHYCEREIVLNRRLEPDLYLDVLPVRNHGSSLVIGGEVGTIIDYAVKMKRVDHQLQMDVLLKTNKVDQDHIKKLAAKIADFHHTAEILYDVDVLAVREKFNDLSSQEKYLSKELGKSSALIITETIEATNSFIDHHTAHLQCRLAQGYVRDCHGDLHTKNIFLLPDPVVFDCIEFNDDYRQIDVLNEVAFLCMDLEAAGRDDLSKLFLQTYTQMFPAIMSEEDNQLLNYYKCYRANVRAKVNSLRSQSASDQFAKQQALSEASRYLQLMKNYARQLTKTN